MNAGTIAQFLKLSPEKTAALEKAWGVASAAAGSAVSLTTAADIYIPCCGVPATISAQIDVAGTVVSATMVVTKMA